MAVLKRILAPGAAVIVALALAQDAPVAQAAIPDLTGAWVPLSGGRGNDPATAPPPASPLLLKPEYRARYDAQRAADAAATKRGEPPASAAVACTPYGMPRMLSIASYPVEILQTPGQVTMITEAFSEVRRIYMHRPMTEGMARALNPKIDWGSLIEDLDKIDYPVASR